MKPKDKTEQKLREQFDKLGEVVTDVGKREIRESRKKIKKLIHKHERNVSKRELKRQLEGKEEVDVF